MNPCKKCLENVWQFKNNRDFPEGKNYYTNWITATCEMCGDEVEFGFKDISYNRPNGKQRFGTKAEYDIRNGKHFLKIKNEFVEVELAKVDKHGRRSIDGEYMKVLPVIGNKITLINYIHKTF